MLRADLYDVDRALATTVAWGLATAVLVVIFVAASLAAGVLLGRDSTVAAAAATAVCAVALAPLRRRLQQRVDARVYPLRQAALAAIDELQREVNVGAARPEQLADRLRAALRDPELRVGYVRPGGSELVEELGSPMDAAGSVPDRQRRDDRSARSPRRRRCSRTSCCGRSPPRRVTLVELVRLRLEVTAALREVEASRARLVQVGDAERRRLERDLHDGAQQRLVSLGMALRLAQRRRKDARSRARRPARPDRGRDRHGGRRAAPDRARPAPELARRRPARGARGPHAARPDPGRACTSSRRRCPTT